MSDIQIFEVMCVTDGMLKERDVVYFDQLEGAAHAKRWSKYTTTGPLVCLSPFAAEIVDKRHVLRF